MGGELGSWSLAITARGSGCRPCVDLDKRCAQVATATVRGSEAVWRRQHGEREVYTDTIGGAFLSNL